MFDNNWMVATIFFVLASVTDVLDGMLARSRNEISLLGSILDPLADKLMLLVVYVGLVYGNFIPVPLPQWFLGLVITHEIILIVGAVYFSLIKQQISISASRLAKLVGFGQFLFIVWALASGFVNPVSSTLFYLVVGLIAFARLVVLVQYGLQMVKVA
jgi:phosphatidylglycerophosphate synthase